MIGKYICNEQRPLEIQVRVTEGHFKVTGRAIISGMLVRTTESAGAVRVFAWQFTPIARNDFSRRMFHTVLKRTTYTLMLPKRECCHIANELDFGYRNYLGTAVCFEMDNFVDWVDRVEPGDVVWDLGLMMTPVSDQLVSNLFLIITLWSWMSSKYSLS